RRSMGDSWLETNGSVMERSEAMSATRIERDPLGELPVPADALYGIQTERARRNFPISNVRPLAPFVDAAIRIKKAAALTNKETGRLDAKLADAITRAADEVLGGAHREQFVVDPYQAGAGTSHNMNCNEVLANRANELLAVKRNPRRAAPAAPDQHVERIEWTAERAGHSNETRYQTVMVKHQRAITGRELREGKDRVQLMQPMGDAGAFSGALRTYAADLGK